MRHVILRDDDTNALTPVECLDRLYSPKSRRPRALRKVGWRNSCIFATAARRPVSR